MSSILQNTTPKDLPRVYRFLDRLALIPEEYRDFVISVVGEFVKGEPDPQLERTYNNPRAVQLGWRVVK